MARKALIETATGKVVNVVEIEAASTWPLPQGHELRDAGNASPGDTWNGTKFVPRPLSVEEIQASKREEAKARAITAIKTNAPQSPWGKILLDLAIAQGLIEPE